MYNKIITIGNLTRDIEIKYLPNGTALAKSSIATSHKYKTQNGEQKDEVCFLDFTIFGRMAEVAQKYLHKGSKVMLEGRLQFDQWTDNQTGAKRSKHSMMVNELKMLGGDREPQSTNGYQPQPQQTNSHIPPVAQAYTEPMQPPMDKIPEIDINEDEIPF